MSRFEKMLVIKFAAKSINDFDRLIELERRIAASMTGSHLLDGHDFGEGEFSLYFFTNAPNELFAQLKDALTTSSYPRMRIAMTRHLSEDKYKTLWQDDDGCN